MARPQQHRILIVDDHPLFRDALKTALSGQFDDVAILEAGSLEEANQALEAQDEVDLVLLDLAMPGVRGFSGLMYLRSQFPQAPVVVVSASEDADTIRRAMEFGASGFIPKTTDLETMRGAIRAIIEGGSWTPPGIALDAVDESSRRLAKKLASLTPQQMRVLMMLSEGLLNKQIAFALQVSEATVKAHVSAILQKLDVDSRTQAVIAASKIEMPLTYQ